MSELRDLAPHEAARLLEEDDEGVVRILDVREPEERAVARIEDSLPATPELVRAAIEEWERGTPLLLYCHHGVRSRIVGFRLLAAGFTNVMNLRRGIEAWALEVDPTMPRYTMRYGEGVVRI